MYNKTVSAVANEFISLFQLFTSIPKWKSLFFATLSLSNFHRVFLHMHSSAAFIVITITKMKFIGILTLVRTAQRHKRAINLLKYRRTFE